MSTLYNPFTIQELQLSYPYINWSYYINWNLNDELHVDENEIVIIFDKKYLTQLNNVLQLTKKRTIANYFAWRTVYNNARLMNGVLRQRRQEFLTKISGNVKSEPRETECVKLTMNQ